MTRFKRSVKATLRDLEERARLEISRKTTLCYDLASETCQIFENVQHMRWFRLAVMKALAAVLKKYRHLVDHVPEIQSSWP